MAGLRSPNRTLVLRLGYVDERVLSQASFSLDKRRALNQLANYLSGLASGTEQGTVSYATDAANWVAASGTVTLSGSTGTAATGTITFSSASGTTTQTINGVTGFSQTTGTDTERATALAAAITASTDPLIAGVLTAASELGVVTISAVTKGTVGNAYTLAVTGTGCARSAATLAGGANNSVGVTINGVTITTNVTTAASDTAAAVLVAADINASSNALVAPFVSATSALGVVTVTADNKGVAGNTITLAASGTGATASGARLTGGSETTPVSVTV